MQDSLILKLQKKMAKVTFDGVAKLVLKNEKKKIENLLNMENQLKFSEILILIKKKLQLL